MKPLAFPLLLDENINPALALELEARGVDVESVLGLGLAGRSDAEILALALREGRVVVTHDSDFGTLAVRAGAGLVGVIFLRPGTIRVEELELMLDAIDDHEVDVVPPFILVAERRGDRVRVRLREL